LERIGKHFRDNKSRYACVGGGFASGMIVGALAFSKGQIAVNAFQWKPFIWITQVSMPKGHYNEAIPVRCVETKEVFASLARAAKANNVNASELSRHIAGKLDSVKGLTFETV
jgi:hypothetical protein